MDVLEFGFTDETVSVSVLVVCVLQMVIYFLVRVVEECGKKLF